MYAIYDKEDVTFSFTKGTMFYAVSSYDEVLTWICVSKNTNKNAIDKRKCSISL